MGELDLMEWDEGDRDLERALARAEKAERALTRAGWTLAEGAQEWRPPLGPAPRFDLVDAADARATRAEAELATTRQERMDVIRERNRAQDETRRLRDLLAGAVEACTPSATTKAAYIGEFHFSQTYTDPDGEEQTARIAVPWTTIKEIMAAILTRADIAAIRAELAETGGAS